jgi:Haem-binding domain
MKKKLKIAAFSLVVIFLLLQLTNPARTNPPVKNDFITAAKPPIEVAASLRAACYDCHSHETTWPLYSKIAPSSWLVVSDVNEGREHLNFSDWPTNVERITRKLDNINDVLDSQEMPPKKYTALHPEARLTDAQRKAIMDWTDAAGKTLTSTNN